MYKTKPRFPCRMPSDAPLNVLALNGSLKHEPTLSGHDHDGREVMLVLLLFSTHGPCTTLEDLHEPDGAD